MLGIGEEFKIKLVMIIKEDNLHSLFAKFLLHIYKSLDEKAFLVCK